MVLDRKNANDFIKEYNEIMPMKRYSKMNIGQKNELIRKKIHTLQHNKLVQDYKALEDKQAKSDEALKTTLAKQGSKKQKADAAKKKAAEKKAGSDASQKNLTKIAQAQKEGRKKMRQMPPGLAKALEAKQRPVAQARPIVRKKKPTATTLKPNQFRNLNNMPAEKSRGAKAGNADIF